MTETPTRTDDEESNTTVRLDPMDRVHYYDTHDLDRDQLDTLEQIAGLVGGLDVAARIEIERERIRRADRDDVLVMFTHQEILRLGRILAGGLESDRSLLESLSSQEYHDLADSLLDIELDEENIPEEKRVSEEITTCHEVIQNRIEEYAPHQSA